MPHPKVADCQNICSLGRARSEDFDPRAADPRGSDPRGAKSRRPNRGLEPRGPIEAAARMTEGVGQADRQATEHSDDQSGQGPERPRTEAAKSQGRIRAAEYLN